LRWLRRAIAVPAVARNNNNNNNSVLGCLYGSLPVIGTVHAEPEAVISRAWVQTPDPAELIVSGLLACML